jgi:quinol monooxygenase YgiN
MVLLALKNPANMSHVLIIHEVEDYRTWKKIFDDAADLRQEAGEIHYQVLKYEDNPNKIVHFSAWRSIAAAKLFFESPQLIQIRIDAGVKSPEFIYLEQLESGVL